MSQKMYDNRHQVLSSFVLPFCHHCYLFYKILCVKSRGTGKNFTEVTSPKSNESTNSTTSAYSFKVQKEKYKNRPAKAKLMMEKSSSFFTKATPMDSQKLQSSMSFSQSKPARTPIIFRTVSAMLAKKHAIPTRKAILLILGCSFQLIATPPKPFPRVSLSNAHVSALRKHFITGFARCQRAICATIQKYSPKVCIFPKILHKYRYLH